MDHSPTNTLVFTVLKDDIVYDVSVSSPVDPQTGRHILYYPSEWRRLGAPTWQTMKVEVGCIAAAPLSPAEHFIFATRVIVGHLGVDADPPMIDTNVIRQLKEGELRSKEKAAEETLFYLDRRLLQVPGQSLTMMEVLSAVVQHPDDIVEALNNYAERRIIIIGVSEGVGFQHTYENLKQVQEFPQLIDLLLTSVQENPAHSGWIRSRAEELRQKSSTPSGDPLRAFISYSTMDKVLAGMIKTCLEKHGLSVFLAHEDLEISDEWMDEIIEELKSCHIFIPLLTDNYKASDWADQEAGYALAFDKKVCPLKAPHNPHGFIRRKQGEPVADSNVEPACEKIIKVIRKDEKLGPLLAKTAPRSQ